MLLDSNPHLLSAKTLDYPLGYRGILINFIQISNCTTIWSARFMKIHKDWMKGHWIFICLGSIWTNNTYIQSYKHNAPISSHWLLCELITHHASCVWYCRWKRKWHINFSMVVYNLTTAKLTRTIFNDKRTIYTLLGDCVFNGRNMLWLNFQLILKLKYMNFWFPVNSVVIWFHYW